MTVIQNYKWSILSWSNVSIEIDFSCPDPHPQLCWKCHTTHVGRQCFLKWERFLIVSQLVHIWDIIHTGRTFPTKVVSAMSWRCGSGFSMINFSSVRVREVYLLLNYTCVEFMGRKKIVHRDWTKRKTCWISVQVLQCLFFFRFAISGKLPPAFSPTMRAYACRQDKRSALEENTVLN